MSESFSIYKSIYIVPASKPLYAEIAEWRKILARLACFLRSVDYALQELMRHLVFSSVKQLLDHLVKSYHAPEKREETDENELVREKYETGKNEFVIEKLRNIVENELVKKK